jgi:uncharacterized protein YqeY
MKLAEQITNDLHQAIKNKDELRISCLRMLKAAIVNKEVEKGREQLKDEDIQALISSSIRKSKESIEEFRKGNREDLISKEEGEIKILLNYLPDQLTPPEIEKILKEVIAELSASGPKDLGKVMKTAMARMGGKVQGKEVNEIAKRLLC